MSDLWVEYKSVEHDDRSRERYPNAQGGAGWTVNCVNRSFPDRTAIPVIFANKPDAERAKHALEDAGLGTYDAMLQKIHVEKDFATVRRVMIESLNW